MKPVKIVEMNHEEYLELLKKDFVETRKLSTMLMVNAVIANVRNDPDHLMRHVYRDVAFVEQAVEDFCSVAWGGIQTQASDCKIATMSGKIRGRFGIGTKLSLATMCTAGRIMITIRKRERFVSMVGAQSGSQFPGLHAIEATAMEAVQMLKLAGRWWGEGRLKLKRDRKIRML